ncbi:MAG TPA: thioredoxin domain-containing protein [Thermomicrobiales bacterium]|nr:thioredoxin domain-containing protein [Thermomicrobiales bacterium]
MPNRLANETSPYLLQHQENPVDWYPWGEEALARARAEDKPILLSIGYSACHWCHVMAHESFEDADTAALMNDLFVNIKVDREERPDLDAIYMEAVQALTGHGGWPMTVFLTPGGEPFYGGTYFPPEARQGLPAFRDVLRGVAQAYRERREDVAHNAAALRERIQAGLQLQTPAGDLTPAVLDQATRVLAQGFDRTHGGFGAAPKFPQPMALDFLLRQYLRTGLPSLLGMVEQTLEKMARGGIYDQLGGGFHRYSVDERWLAPHFEKMLYDNALLAPVYLHAYLVTGKDLYRRIAAETLDWALREMTSEEGGFYATLDADSEGQEGKFYTWTPAEFAALLGEEDARLAAAYFDVTERGNFEHGRSILHLPRDVDVVASREKASIERLGEALDHARFRLREAREERVRPGRDEKILTAWNGLMLRAFAEGAAILERDDYRAAAERAATFLLTTLRRDGRLLRTYKDGRARLNGYLEDYAFLADGLLALYEATFAPRWLAEARALADAMLDLFWDEEQGLFYDTGRDHEALIARPRGVFDNAVPSGGSVAVEVLQRLGTIYNEPRHSQKATRVLRGLRDAMARFPTAFGRLLCALDFALATPREVALAGRRAAPDTLAMLTVIRDHFRPNLVVALREPGTEEISQPALLQGRAMHDGRATAYVCERLTCRLPVTTPEALATQLD